MQKSTLLEIHIWIDNNSDSVRGKKGVLDDLQFNFNLSTDDRVNYTLKAPYTSPDDIDNLAIRIIEEAHSLAERRNCYIEISISNEEFEKSWD